VNRLIILTCFLIVCISTGVNAQEAASTGISQKESEPSSKFKFKAISDPSVAAGIDVRKIDRWISYYFKNMVPVGKKFPTLKELVVARQKGCIESPENCPPLSDIPSLCSNTIAQSDATLGLFWKLYNSTFDLANDTDGLLANISGCSKELTEGKLLGYLVAIVMTEKQGKWSALSKIISSLEQENVVNLPDIKYLVHLNAAIEAMGRSKKFPLAPISRLVVQSLVWAQSSPLDPKYKEVEEWLNIIIDTLPPLGREVTFTTLLPKHKELRESDSFRVRSMIGRLVCNYARQTNQFPLCDQQLAALRILPESKSNGPRMMLQFMSATNMLYAGKRAQALASFQAMIKSLDPTSPMLSWQYLMLGISQIHSGDYVGAEKSVKKHMELLPKNSNQLNSFMGPGTALSILVESGKYPEARLAASQLKAKMLSSVEGSFESLVWVDFNQLFLSLEMKNQVEAEKAYKDLLKHVNPLPLFQYVKLMGQALMEKSKGRSPNIEPIKKILGPNHYEVQHLQRLLEKIK
jgi:tetratricopeptide (TPR) repeat protein